MSAEDWERRPQSICRILRRPGHPDIESFGAVARFVLRESDDGQCCDWFKRRPFVDGGEYGDAEGYALIYDYVRSDP